MTSLARRAGYTMQVRMTKRFVRGIFEGMTIEDTLSMVDTAHAERFIAAIRRNCLAGRLNYMLEAASIEPIKE